MEYAERGALLEWDSKKQLFSLPNSVPLNDEKYFRKIFI